MTHRPKGPAEIQSAALFAGQPSAEGGGGGAERRVIVTGTGRKQFFAKQQTASKFFAKIFFRNKIFLLSHPDTADGFTV
jgi:hypothetical protein